MSTKAERRIDALNQHYSRLERLALYCGVKSPDGKKLSGALLKLEREAHQAAEDYSNGTRFTGDTNEWETFTERITQQVQALFNGKLNGFLLNGDPRGYALKIAPEITAKLEQQGTVRLHTDFGGYGILSPEITGD